MNRRTKHFLKVLADFQQEHGRSPTPGEWAAAGGVKNSAWMASKANYLEAHGWVENERTSHGVLVPGTIKITPLGIKAITEEL